MPGDRLRQNRADLISGHIFKYGGGQITNHDPTTMTIEEYLDYPLHSRYTDGNCKVEIYYDEYPEDCDPRETGTQIGTMLMHRDRYSLGDYESDLARSWDSKVSNYCSYYNAMSLAATLLEGDECDWPETRAEVKWGEAPDIRVLIPIEISDWGYQLKISQRGETVIGQRACRNYLIDMLTGDIDYIDGVYILTQDEFSDLELTPSISGCKSAAEMMESQLQEYAAWVAGEVFGITITDHESESWGYSGIIGEDWVAEAAIAELEGLAKSEQTDLARISDWSNKMGEAFTGLTAPLSLSPDMATIYRQSEVSA